MSGRLYFLFTEQRMRSSPWERNCIYPLCFLFLVAMTLVALALVAVNILSLIINPTEQLTVQVSRTLSSQSGFLETKYTRPFTYMPQMLSQHHRLNQDNVFKLPGSISCLVCTI